MKEQLFLNNAIKNLCYDGEKVEEKDEIINN